MVVTEDKQFSSLTKQINVFSFSEIILIKILFWFVSNLKWIDVAIEIGLKCKSKPPYPFELSKHHIRDEVVYLTNEIMVGWHSNYRLAIKNNCKNLDSPGSCKVDIT